MTKTRSDYRRYESEYSFSNWHMLEIVFTFVSFNHIRVNCKMIAILFLPSEQMPKEKNGSSFSIECVPDLIEFIFVLY